MPGKMSRGVVIVGAGQAGFQTAVSLRAEGYEEPITIIGDEPHLPYQRPPLSKGFMTGGQEIEATELRPATFYSDKRIRMMMGEVAVEIDTAANSVMLPKGARVDYDALVLAVGARNRPLPIPGADLDGVCYLRDRHEAVIIRERLDAAENIVVIGGGFIGLELAAAARSHGKSVTVLEAQPRLMPRVVAPILSAFYRDLHTAQGVCVGLDAAVSEILGDGSKARAVVLSDGTVLPADLVLVGIGVIPNAELAASAGLEIANGIVVDEYLRTSVPNIYAIGDCAAHPNPFAGALVRIESVQNAVDQAKCVAGAIVGRAQPYRSVPWFWTDQFHIHLQMVGLSTGCDRVVTRGELEDSKFSVFYFKDGRLAAIDSVNRPGDHLAGRKLIAGGVALTPEQAADASVDIKALARAVSV
jgi:3-phenylpropionate/trans-cinnamate dioxygenase ferredoxin reductase subunit